MRVFGPAQRVSPCLAIALTLLIVLFAGSASSTVIRWSRATGNSGAVANTHYAGIGNDVLPQYGLLASSSLLFSDVLSLTTRSNLLELSGPYTRFVRHSFHTRLVGALGPTLKVSEDATTSHPLIQFVTGPARPEG